ncbi:MAG: hypothetical protein ONB05_06600 [candidate division KSB1 bacterium]|nr:hypothetical protein [candidate division KSB1 bacterium]
MNFLRVLICLVIFIPPLLWAQEGKKETIEERLVRIEANQQSLEKRLEDLRTDMGKYFELIDKRFEAVDKRFEAVDKRFDDLRFWLQFILGAMVLMIGAIVAQWMLVWRKVDRIEARVEERIVIGYREEEIRELKRRLERLEARIAG